MHNFVQDNIDSNCCMRLKIAAMSLLEDGDLATETLGVMMVLSEVGR